MYRKLARIVRQVVDSHTDVVRHAASSSGQSATNDLSAQWQRTGQGKTSSSGRSLVGVQPKYADPETTESAMLVPAGTLEPRTGSTWYSRVKPPGTRPSPAGSRPPRDPPHSLPGRRTSLV